MTKREWSHLPNATHIDWVIKTLKENPKVWEAPLDAMRGVAWKAARDAARYAELDAARDAAWDASRDASWDAAGDAVGAAWEAARGAIIALVAWDESSELLTMPITHVERLVKLEMPAAILLLPAVIVKHNLTNVRN